MAQNIIVPNKDNLVVLTFAGVDLTLATDLKVQFGAESFTLILDPTIVIVDSATQLSLDLSGTAEVGQKFITVTYFDAGSTNGTDITSRELGNLGRIIVAIGTVLIIEDGSIVANANSVVSDAELKAYTDLRGVSIPATQPEREALLIIAMDYLKTIEKRMQGQRTDETQSLPEPRINVRIRDFFIDDDVIPAEYKIAQIEAAIAANEFDLLKTSSGSSNVASEKIGSLSVSYFDGGNFETIRIEPVFAALDPLLAFGSGSFGRVLRSL